MGSDMNKQELQPNLDDADCIFDFVDTLSNGYESDAYSESNSLILGLDNSSECDGGQSHDIDFSEFEDNSTGIITNRRLESREMVIAEIERLIEQQVDVLLDQTGTLKLCIKTKTSSNMNHDGRLNAQASFETRTYQFPATSAAEEWRFTVIFRLLCMIHEALVADVTVTKRDLYYRDPNLFRSQNTVDRYVDDISRSFGVPRSLLNVTSTAKGLAAGTFHLSRMDGSAVNGNDGDEGWLITSMDVVQRINMDSTEWMLVVEKEATFRSILESPFWVTAKFKGILVTAKGYPDLLTREFVNLVSLSSERNGFRSCPVYGLFDFDSDGIGILHTYKHGAVKTAHETPSSPCEKMEWVGVKSSDAFLVSELQQGLLSLSSRDRRRASRMLSWPAFDKSASDCSPRRELQVMLFVNKKAEIQLMEALPGGLSAKLPSMLARKRTREPLPRSVA